MIDEKVMRDRGAARPKRTDVICAICHMKVKAREVQLSQARNGDILRVCPSCGAKRARLAKLHRPRPGEVQRAG